MEKNKKFSLVSGWCFALVNGKLAEIFFDRKDDRLEILGFCHVDKKDYKTKNIHGAPKERVNLVRY